MKQPPTDQAMWFAVYTRYRCEKAVWRSLDKQGIANFLPIIHTPRLHGSRRRIVECPLIPGYIFVRIALADYLPVLQTDNVIDLVRFGAEIVPITEEEMELLQRFCTDHSYEVIVSSQTYHTGDMVQVVAGPLKGIIGKLVTIQGHKSLVVELKNVGRSLQVVRMEKRHVRLLSSAGA